MILQGIPVSYRLEDMEDLTPEDDSDTMVAGLTRITVGLTILAIEVTEGMALEVTEGTGEMVSKVETDIKAVAEVKIDR